MERSPFNNPEEHGDEQEDSSSGVTKKRTRRFGDLFARQEERSAEQAEDLTPPSLWQRFINRIQPEAPAEAAREPEFEADPGVDEFVELPTDELPEEQIPAYEFADDESPAVLSALAEARLEAIGDLPEEEPGVTSTVADFLQEVAIRGNLDEAEARVIPEVAELSVPAPLPTERPSELPSHELPLWEPPREPSPRVEPPRHPAPEKVVIKDREYDYISPAVVGTVTGYLLGRRRGHLKTQKRLEVAQKRLEKRVHNLEEQLQARETHIRRMAAERVRPASLPLQERPRLRPEQFIRVTAPEAHHLHGTKAPERIGKVVVQGPRVEAAIRPRSSAPMETAPRSAVKEVVAQVQTLNRAELLTLAGSIYIDGANLRQVYETHLIGEHGLRRLAAEHLSGGDMKRALQREITEHQIDFERDPHLRDRAYKSTAGQTALTPSASTVPATDTLSDLLERAGAGMDDRVRSEAAVLRARAAHEARESARRSREQRIVDTSMTGIILVLVAIIAVLIITR